MVTKIGFAVSVQVGAAQALIRPLPYSEEFARRESALSIARQHLDLITAPTIGHEIDRAAAAKIRRHHTVRMRMRFGAHRRPARLAEASLRIAQQDADEGRLRVHSCDIGMPVLIEISYRHVVGL